MLRIKMEDMKEIYTKADYSAASVRQQLLKNGISVSSVKLQPDEPLRMSGEVIAASNDGTVFHGRAEMIGYRLATGHIGYNIFGMPHALYLGTCTPQKLSMKAEGRIFDTAQKLCRFLKEKEQILTLFRKENPSLFFRIDAFSAQIPENKADSLIKAEAYLDRINGISEEMEYTNDFKAKILRDVRDLGLDKACAKALLVSEKCGDGAVLTRNAGEHAGRWDIAKAVQNVKKKGLVPYHVIQGPIMVTVLYETSNEDMEPKNYTSDGADHCILAYAYNTVQPEMSEFGPVFTKTAHGALVRVQ